MQEETPNTTPETTGNTEKQIPEVVEQTKKINPNLILTIVNAALLVGLVVLYFIVLKPGGKDDTNYALMQKASSGSVKIAYVNSDSILMHYDFVKSMRTELETKTARLETELKKKQSAFEKDAAYFQDQVSKKSISEASAQEIYGQLTAEQQKLVELRDQYSSELSKQEYDLNLLLLDSLNNFLKRYNKKLNFDYILSYSKGGSILTANDSLDITKDVVKLLNEEYAAAKK